MVTKEVAAMSDKSKKKNGLVGTLIIVLIAVVGIFGLGKLGLKIIKEGKVEYIIDMGNNSGSGKDASKAGENGYEDTYGRIQDGTKGTSLLDLKDELASGSPGLNQTNSNADDALVSQSSAGSGEYDLEGGSNDVIYDENFGEAGEELTQEEIDRIAIFAKYFTSTYAPAAETVSGMHIPLADEAVIKTMSILANDYMGTDDEMAQYVIPGTYDGGALYVTKDDIDQYIADLFGYTDIIYYELGSVQSNGDGYVMYAHQGNCDTTITVNETYTEGENYIMKGIASLNYMDIFDPRFVDAEFTFTFRRNSDSPFGFTYVDFEFGEVTYQ